MTDLKLNWHSHKVGAYCASGRAHVWLHAELGGKWSVRMSVQAGASGDDYEINGEALNMAEAKKAAEAAAANFLEQYGRSK
jgi:hypothetical protein